MQTTTTTTTTTKTLMVITVATRAIGRQMFFDFREFFFAFFVIFFSFTGSNLCQKCISSCTSYIYDTAFVLLALLAFVLRFLIAFIRLTVGIISTAIPSVHIHINECLNNKQNWIKLVKRNLPTITLSRAIQQQQLHRHRQQQLQANSSKSYKRSTRKRQHKWRKKPLKLFVPNELVVSRLAFERCTCHRIRWRSSSNAY